MFESFEVNFDNTVALIMCQQQLQLQLIELYDEVDKQNKVNIWLIKVCFNHVVIWLDEKYIQVVQVEVS